MGKCRRAACGGFLTFFGIACIVVGSILLKYAGDDADKIVIYNQYVDAWKNGGAAAVRDIDDLSLGSDASSPLRHLLDTPDPRPLTAKGGLTATTYTQRVRWDWANSTVTSPFSSLPYGTVGYGQEHHRFISLNYNGVNIANGLAPLLRVKSYDLTCSSKKSSSFRKKLSFSSSSFSSSSSSSCVLSPCNGEIDFVNNVCRVFLKLTDVCLTVPAGELKNAQHRVDSGMPVTPMELGVRGCTFMDSSYCKKDSEECSSAYGYLVVPKGSLPPTDFSHVPVTLRVQEDPYSIAMQLTEGTMSFNDGTAMLIAGKVLLAVGIVTLGVPFLLLLAALISKFMRSGGNFATRLLEKL